MANKDFICFNRGTGPIELTHKVFEMKPVELHLKENGDIDGNPSIAIIMTDFRNIPVLGQISVKMLNEGLEDIGYKLVKL